MLALMPEQDVTFQIHQELLILHIPHEHVCRIAQRLREAKSRVGQLGRLLAPTVYS